MGHLQIPAGHQLAHCTGPYTAVDELHTCHPAAHVAPILGRGQDLHRLGPQPRDGVVGQRVGAAPLREIDRCHDLVTSDQRHRIGPMRVGTDQLVAHVNRIGGGTVVPIVADLIPLTVPHPQVRVVVGHDDTLCRRYGMASCAGVQAHVQGAARLARPGPGIAADGLRQGNAVQVVGAVQVPDIVRLGYTRAAPGRVHPDPGVVGHGPRAGARGRQLGQGPVGPGRAAVVEYAAAARSPGRGRQ